MVFGSLMKICTRGFQTSAVQNQIIKLSRLRVVDNSDIGKEAMMIGKPPRTIHIYNKKGVGQIGTFQKYICLLFLFANNIFY